MSKVKLYEFRWDTSGQHRILYDPESGELAPIEAYVLFTDYAEKEAENKRLRDGIEKSK